MWGASYHSNGLIQLFARIFTMLLFHYVSICFPSLVYTHSGGGGSYHFYGLIQLFDFLEYKDIKLRTYVWLAHISIFILI